MSKLLEHPKALCNQVRRVALAAGEITLHYFEEAGFEGADAKADGSPVTIADQEAEAHIEKALADIIPDVPFVGEEAVAAGRIPDVSDQGYYWLVDALDGTKGFIAGEPSFTVNIALIKDGSPILGVVYAPATGELFAGAEGSAVRWLEDTNNEKAIHVRKPPKEGLTVVASRHHGGGKDMDNFLADYKVEKMIKKDSSLKICAVAMGKADLYPRFGPTCEWDTAAAHAVLLAAGGEITDTDGNPLRYGCFNPKFLNPQFIASSGQI